MFFKVKFQLVILQVQQFIDFLAQLHLHCFIFGVYPYLQKSVFFSFAENYAHNLGRVEGLAEAGEKECFPLPIEECLLVPFIR